MWLNFKRITKKRFFVFIFLLRMIINSPSGGSTGTGELWSSREPACHLPLSGPPRIQKKNKKLHVSPAQHTKTRRGIQAIPTGEATRRETQKNKVLGEQKKNTRKVVRLFSQCHSGLCGGQTLSGGFSFCGPPHVAHPCCLPPLMPDARWKFGGRRQRGDFSADHQRFLCFGILAG